MSAGNRKAPSPINNKRALINKYSGTVKTTISTADQRALTNGAELAPAALGAMQARVREQSCSMKCPKEKNQTVLKHSEENNLGQIFRMHYSWAFQESH